MKASNIENIIKLLQKQLNKNLKLTKYDGITLECEVSDNIDKWISQVTDICNTLKLIPNSIEISRYKNNTFIVQFPEMTPVYTKTQINKMYNSNFKWILDNLIKGDKTQKINKQLLISFKGIITKEAIQTFYRSNVNKYKEALEDYLNNMDYRHQVDLLFDEFLNNYEI